MHGLHGDRRFSHGRLGYLSVLTLGELRKGIDAVPDRKRRAALPAASHDLAMVTRNARDFAGLGIAVVDPWTDEGSGPRYRVQEPARRVSRARPRGGA
ncbi:MAG: hypothetical protein ABS56_07675 [Lautropia sp. SCN 69-89]|nr:MAG: hypothetical protein ABS56_07675 [Lautropia sp. SCN 69-89]